MKLTQPAWPRVFSSKTVLAIATLGPIGRRLPAPGTWGSVAGLLYFTLFFALGTGSATVAILNVSGFLVAVSFCGEAEIRMGRTDPGEVILDEFVAMPFCFLGWDRLSAQQPAWIVLLGGLGLFRLFDIVKPYGIRRLQRLPGGWGVVCDDIAAALATCAVLHGALWAAHIVHI